MLKRVFFILASLSLFAVLSETGQASFADKAQLADKDKIKKFIPKGFSILDKISGDLNGNKYTDLILVLKKDGEEKMYDPAPKRPVLILTGGPNQEYKMAVKNENAVYTHDMGGASKSDPYDRIEIENGIFKIEHSGGMGRHRWSITNTFQYFPKERIWYLVKMENNEMVLNYHSDDTSATEPQITVDRDTTTTKTEKDFGKVPFEKFNIFEEEK